MTRLRPRPRHVWLTLGVTAILSLSGNAFAGDNLKARGHRSSADWKAVGAPGNAGDRTVARDGSSRHGSVAYSFEIARTELTNAEYARFLNAVAGEADDLMLFNPLMDPDVGPGTGSGLRRTGLPGRYKYAPLRGHEHRPINYVSVFDGMRYANWLHNGGSANSSTEKGAYELRGRTAVPVNAGTVLRSKGARIALPTEDEWHKAAYYDARSKRYWRYPTASNNPPLCGQPGSPRHAANCNPDIAGGAPTDRRLVDVGSYPAFPSAFGTLDQGGNVYEWTETLIARDPSGSSAVRTPTPGALRVQRGASIYEPAEETGSVSRASNYGESEFAATGLRLVRLPSKH